MDAEFWENAKPRFVQPQEEEITPTQQEYQILIHCLVNRSRALKQPTDKKYCTNQYYAQRNYTPEQIPLDRVCEETLLQGFQFVPGEFTHNPDPDIGIRDTVNWQSQQLFLVEFDNTTENTLDAFITARPFLQQHAWFLTESLRSRYNDPDDKKCNGQLRVRVALCMPHAVKTLEERDWIYEAFVKDLPGCDDGSAISVTNGGLGKRNPEHIKIGKIVGIDWFNRAIDTGMKAEQEKKAEQKRIAEAYKRKQTQRPAKGFTEREGELPLEALAKTDPGPFLQSLGVSPKSESGKYHRWGRTEKRGDTALSIWRSDFGYYQIRVFANSIPVPPAVSGAMPFTRFYCFHELNTDIEGLKPNTDTWKQINAELATRGYGTWLSDTQFHAKNKSLSRKTQTYQSHQHQRKSTARILYHEHKSARKGVRTRRSRERA